MNVLKDIPSTLMEIEKMEMKSIGVLIETKRLNSEIRKLLGEKRRVLISKVQQGVNYKEDLKEFKEIIKRIEGK